MRLFCEGTILEIFNQAAFKAFLLWLPVFYLYHGLGITLGYHRLLTHKALKVPRWLSYFIVSGGYFCLMGSPIVWVGVHRQHHQKSDLPGDPHSPREGFVHALYGWMFDMRRVQSDAELQAQVPELMSDRFYRLLGDTHDPYQAQLCLGVNIVFRLLLWATIGFPAMMASVISTAIVFWSTQLVNAVCHLPGAGYRSHDTYEDSLNVWWVALLALGEGWHNNHHAIPKSARHGMSWWELDITWISIVVLEKLGLAKNVIRPEKIRKVQSTVPATPAFASEAFASSAAGSEETIMMTEPILLTEPVLVKERVMADAQ
jgi:fatty-acid desaturase